ncbi:MAG: DUF4328 domain-containing protein [Acidimicrobiales bacterium]
MIPSSPAPPSDGLARAIRIMSGLVAVASVLLVSGNIRAAGAFRTWWDAPPWEQQGAFDEWMRVDNGVNSWNIIFVVAWLTTVVLVMVWSNKAHKYLQWVRPGPRRWSSGWTVGGWFVPVANIVIPRLVLNELERVARHPAPTPSHPTPSPAPVKLRPVGLVWWCSFVLVWLLHHTGTALAPRPLAYESLGRPETMTGGYGPGLIAALVGVPAGIAGVKYFRRVHTDLTDTVETVYF